MRIYRVYTEDLQDGVAEGIAADHFNAFTVINGQGCWQGKFENSLIIEVLTEDETGIRQMAKAIRATNKQYAVLVVALDCHSELITEAS